MTEISHILAQNAIEENRSSQTEKYGKPGTRRIRSGDKCLPVILYICILVCKLAAWCQCMYVRMYVCMDGYICMCVYIYNIVTRVPGIHQRYMGRCCYCDHTEDRNLHDRCVCWSPAHWQLSATPQLVVLGNSPGTNSQSSDVSVIYLKTCWGQ